ncbi:DUF2490 domain-containing protein [Belliella sp. DSM 111904]|uniref:DUF2490 domain-containing protein n=1 Tax=Belliella filtrata TaxID=2923435 RepID=A0ABS9V583_9BACT|nr:DUF2490 domain-containing protein [Belliella filtrata]MCH7411558.1 DUF2490 domain-containing protein [Belliella filtrata]
MLFSVSILAQNNRINTRENIGWYNAFGTFKVSDKFDVHSEFQIRKSDFITDWQQFLLRFGVNYHLNERVMFRAGAAWIETFPYGEVPVNVFGMQFSQYKTFQMVRLIQYEGRLSIHHRFMLEQRFVGRFDSPSSASEDDFLYQDRVRYMLRTYLPLNNPQIIDRTYYLVFFDEVFTGFGENVNANIFDQNRLGLLLGYRFNKNLRIDAGYMNQIIQFGRQINGQNIFQTNHGFMINSNINIDLRKYK